MKEEDKKELKDKKGTHLIIGVLIGLGIAILINIVSIPESINPDSTEITTKNPNSNVSLTGRHGYGDYLNFEYEIVPYVHGYFVVIKNKNTGELSTAGLH